jgi:hypothetical protein
MGIHDASSPNGSIRLHEWVYVLVATFLASKDRWEEMILPRQRAHRVISVMSNLSKNILSVACVDGVGPPSGSIKFEDCVYVPDSSVVSALILVATPVGG